MRNAVLHELCHYVFGMKNAVDQAGYRCLLFVNSGRELWSCALVMCSGSVGVLIDCSGPIGSEINRRTV